MPGWYQADGRGTGLQLHDCRKVRNSSLQRPQGTPPCSEAATRTLLWAVTSGIGNVRFCRRQGRTPRARRETSAMPT